MWFDVLTKPLQGTLFKKIMAMLINYPVEYVDSCTKDVDKVVGVSNQDYFPITSRLMNPLEINKLCFMASPQEFFGRVTKH